MENIEERSRDVDDTVRMMYVKSGPERDEREAKHDQYKERIRMSTEVPLLNLTQGKHGMDSSLLKETYIEL